MVRPPAAYPAAATSDWAASRLAKLLDTSAEVRLGLQNGWDLWHAAQALRKAG